MAYDHTMMRTIDSADVDAHGRVAFARLFEWMAEAAAGLFAAAGLGEAMDIEGGRVDWVTSHAECDFFAPVIVGQSVEVNLRVNRMTARMIRYDVTFTRRDPAAADVQLARGILENICVCIDSTGSINPIDIPPAITDHIEQAPAQMLD